MPPTGSKCSGVAQLAERLIVNQKVGGSSPPLRAKYAGIAKLVKATGLRPVI
jgi:hypothetical protein